MAERMQELKPAIMQTVVSQEYSDWMKGLPAKVRDEAQAVKKLALDEPGFWGKQEIMVEVFAPFVKLLRLADSALPAASKVSTRCLPSPNASECVN